MKNLTITIPGLELHAQTWGTITSENKILALHGWLDNSSSFQRLAPLIQNAQIIALDLPGHGHSDHRPPGARYHIIDYVPDIIAVLDLLSWDKVTLLGHSLGGSICCMVAGSFPDRLHKLALIDSIGALTHEAHEVPVKLRQSILREQQIAIKASRKYNTIESAIQARIRNSDLSYESACIITHRNIKKINEDFYWRFDPRLLYPSLCRLTDAQAQAFIQNITVPVCELQADPGYPYDKAKFAKALSLVQNLEYHLIQGNHYPHLEQAEVVAMHLNKFFGF